MPHPNDIGPEGRCIICQDRRCIQEAVRLFEADAIRQEFEPELDSLVVSPENARDVLATAGVMACPAWADAGWVVNPTLAGACGSPVAVKVVVAMPAVAITV